MSKSINRIPKTAIKNAEKGIRDEHGFYVMEPTVDLMVNRNKKGSKKSSGEKLDYDQIRLIVEKNAKRVKFGDFENAALIRGKGKKEQEDALRANRAQLDSFIDQVIESGKIPGDTLDVAIRLIRIAKTFYEFADPEIQQKWIDDKRYDAFLTILKGYVDEPSGYTPEETDSDGGKKKKVKTEAVDSQYGNLAINMDKCYIVHKDDEIPEGVKETDSIEAWLTRSYKTLKLDPTDKVKLVAAPKLDGIAIRGEITPENRLVNPMSRGDEARSILVKGLNGVRFLDSSKPLNKDPFGCQFEAFLTYDDTERASDYLEKKTPFVSPRHAASGLINRLCTDQDAKMVQLLCFYPINSEGLDGSYLENLKKIQKLGNCPEDIVGVEVLEGDMPELLKRITKYFNHLNDIRSSLSYPIDGLVLSFAEKDHQSELGRSGRTNKWQMALKFDPSSAVGKVKGIELSPGKKGFRTIQLCLEEPVIVDGVKYDHIPILSAEIFDKLGLCKGDDVRVHRVGDVIPTISVEKRHDGDKLELPDKCPICGQKMIREAKKMKCVNMDCNANCAGRLLTFFNIARIKGIGDAVAADLVEAGFHDVIAIIETDADSKKFTKAGFSEKRAKELQKQILDAFEWMRDYEVIAAMGFPGIGVATAKSMLTIVSLPDVIENPHNVEYDGGGVWGHPVHDTYWEEYGKSLCLSECLEKNDEMIKMVKRYFPYIKNFSTLTSLNNCKSVGHTGIELSDKIRDLIRKLGWDIVDGCVFDYLIVPSYDHKSRKVDRALAKVIDAIAGLQSSNFTDEKRAKRNGHIFTENDFIAKFGSKAK